MYESFAYKYVCALRMCLVPVEVRGGIAVPGTRVSYDCKPPCRFWKLYSGPVQELTVVDTPMA